MPAAIGFVIATEVLLLTGTTAVAVGNGIGLAITIGLSYGANALLASQREQDTSVTNLVKSTVSPRMRCYGRRRYAGAQVFNDAAGSYLYRVQAFSEAGLDGIDGFEAHVIDDDIVTLDLNGYVTAPARFQGFDGAPLRILTRDGAAAQTHYAELEAVFADWDATHRGDGVAHAMMEMVQVGPEQMQHLWPRLYNTEYKAQIRGVKIYDPRTAVTAWSNNSALVARDHLLHESGFGMAPAWIEAETAQWQQAANDCADAIALKGGGTRPRYTTNVQYTYAERPVDVLTKILASCNGKMLPGPNGGIGLHVGKWVEPEFTIRRSMILSSQLSAGADADSARNVIKAVYHSAAHGYVDQDADPWVNAADVTLRGAKVGDLALGAVDNHPQARALQKQAAAKLAPRWKGMVSTNLAALPCLSERFVWLELEDDIGETFTVEIDDVQFRTERNGQLTGLDIYWTSATADDFAFDGPAEEGRAPPVAPDTSSTAVLSPPASFAVIAANRTAGVSNYVVAVTSWAALTADWLTVDVEYKTAAAGAWSPLGSVADGTTALESGALLDGTTYQFRARTRSATGRISAWTSPVVSVAVTVNPTPPPALQSFAAAAIDNDVTLTLRLPNTTNIAGARLWRNTANTLTGAVQIATVYGTANQLLTFIDQDLVQATFWWFAIPINASGVEGPSSVASVAVPDPLFLSDDDVVDSLTSDDGATELIG